MPDEASVVDCGSDDLSPDRRQRPLFAPAETKQFLETIATEPATEASTEWRGPVMSPVIQASSPVAVQSQFRDQGA